MYKSHVDPVFTQCIGEMKNNGKGEIRVKEEEI